MTTPAPASSTDDMLTVTEVAMLIGKKYAKTRDLILQRHFGTPTYDSGRMRVSRAAVEKWLASRTEGDV